MDQERFLQIDALFDELLDAVPEEREELLRLRTAGDDELRAEVSRLLVAAGESQDFIESPGFASFNDVLKDDHADLSGRKLGAYRLTRMLGRGGMGVVYLASRTDDFEKEVAVKFIPPLENRRGADENFRRERQILAQLAHPNIAQILDGGTADDGAPFLVMEYVDGLPLDRFCRDRGLAISEILKLFVEVCGAVAFAHRNLVVHRDLKPNNILVTADGTPKLLDFGIAKLLTAEPTGDAPRTLETGALTPEYASPEQITGEPITTASDVYSLGVVLFEALTGRRPFDLREKSLAEIIDVVREREAPAPSGIIGRRTGINAAELDSVVLKSLAKEPLERYASVDDFRADLANLLADQPVSARPDSGYYRLRKYVRRNKFEVAIGLVFIAILVGWFATAFVQARSLARQASENRRSAYSAEMILAANEYENANLNRLREIVERNRPEDGEEDLRGFEWHFLNGLLNPSTRVGGFRHPDEVWNAEFSPDGRLIASACNDNRVRIWNVATGAEIVTGELRGAWKVSFFPDGSKIAVAASSNGTPLVRIYDVEDGREILTFTGHSKRVRAIDVSPDGRSIVTGSQDGFVILWDASTGAVKRKIELATPDHPVEVYDIQFAKDGRHVAVSGFETIGVIDFADGSIKLASLNDFADRGVFAIGWKIVYSPLEKTLAVGLFSGDLAFLDIATLKILRVVKLHQSNLKSLAFTTDGRTLVTGSGDRTVKFVDVGTGALTGELRGHFSGVHEVAFSPDGRLLATASADFDLSFWDAAAVMRGNALLTGATVFTFDQKRDLVFGARPATFEVGAWEVPTKRSLFMLRTETRPTSMAAAVDGSRVAFGESNGFVSYFDASNMKNLWRVQPSQKVVYSVAVSVDGKRLLAGAEDGSVHCLDTADGHEIYTIPAAADLIKTIAVSPDGRTFAAAGNDKIVRLFSFENGVLLKSLEGNRKPILKLAYSNDGREVASAGADDTVRIWDVSDGRLRLELSGMSAGVFAIAYSPDGKRIATASDVGVVRLWNSATGEQVLAFTASQRQLQHLRFSVDGRSITTIDADGKIASWNAAE